MANCFECKVYGLNISVLCPDCDEEGNPKESCYQFEPKEDKKEDETNI
jgi:hypothetical protein